MLHDPVVAGGHVALAQVVALENHRRFIEVKAVLQHPILVIPAPAMPSFKEVVVITPQFHYFHVLNLNDECLIILPIFFYFHFLSGQAVV